MRLKRFSGIGPRGVGNRTRARRRPRIGSVSESQPPPVQSDIAVLTRLSDISDGARSRRREGVTLPVVDYRRTMHKLGRNDPCHCGSGKKFKKCHGAPPAQKLPAPKQNLSMTIPAGMPGMLQYVGFVALPATAEPYTPIAGGAPGLYKVVLTLSRQGQPLMPEAQITTFENMQGDSHLAIASPAYHPPWLPPDDPVANIILQTQTDDGTFSLIGKPNPRGFLGQIIAEAMPATDAQDARTKVYRALASSLSNIAIQLDMPISVYQSDMIELATGNRFVSIMSPHVERPMEIAPTATMTKEFRSLAALYREALNSNTPAFQFLCYYKVLEGIRKRRDRLIAEAKAASVEVPKTPRKVVPSDPAEFLPWLHAIYGKGRAWDYIMLESIFVPDARGKKFNQIIDDYLRPVRDRIAHAVLDSGEPTLSADEDLDMREIYKWLSLMKCIARHMLRSDFPKEFLPYLNDVGEYVPEHL